MQKGIVLEAKKKKMIVLTSNAEIFALHRRNRQIEIGEDIYFEYKDIRGGVLTNVLSLLRSRYLFSVCAAAMLIFITFIIRPFDTNAYAYVNIESSASLELTLNKNLQVVNIKAFNDKADDVVHTIGDGWRGKRLEELSDQIIQMNKEDGSLMDDNRLIFATSYPSEQSNYVKSKIDEILYSEGQRHKLSIINCQVSDGIRKKSLTNEISAMKMAILIKANNKGINLTNNEVRNKKIKDIEYETGDIHSLVGNEVSDKEYDNWQRHRDIRSDMNVKTIANNPIKYKQYNHTKQKQLFSKKEVVQNKYVQTNQQDAIRQEVSKTEKMEVISGTKVHGFNKNKSSNANSHSNKSNNYNQLLKFSETLVNIPKSNSELRGKKDPKLSNKPELFVSKQKKPNF